MRAGLIHTPEPLHKPVEYEQRLAHVILSRMCAGELLLEICANDGWMPTHETVRMWAVQDIDGFHEKYELAREMQSHALFEKGIQMGTKDQSHALENLQARKLKVDTLMRAAAKINPRTYGDKPDEKGGIHVYFNTNLGDGKKYKDTNGKYSYTVAQPK